jgi:hypothetical protein
LDAPTAKEVKARSPVLAAQFPEEADEAVLDTLIEVTAPLVGSLTGRIIAGTEGEDVPVALRPLAVMAIALKTAAMFPDGASAEAAEEAVANSKLRSISAGSWSESYFGPGDAAQAKQLDLDPTLASLLWALCTEEKKAEWIGLWDPNNAPGFSVVESFDYGQRPGGY